MTVARSGRIFDATLLFELYNWVFTLTLSTGNMKRNANDRQDKMQELPEPLPFVRKSTRRPAEVSREILVKMWNDLRSKPFQNDDWDLTLLELTDSKCFRKDCNEL